MIGIDELDSGKFSWSVLIEGDQLHESEWRFISERAVFDHLLMVHAMMQIFVNGAASEANPKTKTVEIIDIDGGLGWLILLKNRGALEKSSRVFETPGEAFENLLRVYTELTLFIASIAKSKVIDHE